MQTTEKLSPRDGNQPHPSTRRKRIRFWSPEGPLIWMLPAVLLLLLYSVYPLVYNIMNSFKEFDPMVRGFVPVGLENWDFLFHDSRALNSLRVTFTFGIAALAVELTLGMAIVVLFRIIDLYRLFDYIYVMTSGGPVQIRPIRQIRVLSEGAHPIWLVD
jgi:ABC-type sugar transport system permease subunit